MSTVTSSNRRRGNRGRRAKPFNGETPAAAAGRKAAIERRVANELETLDFSRRAVQLRRLNKPYPEIAMIMSEERGERVTTDKVRRYVLNALRDVDAENDVRFAELDKLESMAANVRQKIEDYENIEPHLFDLEQYSKLVDTYLKYRDRVARLLGLDQGGNNGGKGVIATGKQSAADAQAAVVAQNHLHFHGGSVDAFEQWQELQGLGLTQLAREVLALQAEPADAAMTGTHNDAAHTVLAPHVDLTPEAERLALPQSSLEALAAMAREDAAE